MAMRKFQRDVDKRVFKKEYIILKAVHRIPDKEQENLMDSNFNSGYDLDGHRVKTNEETAEGNHNANPFWDEMSPSDSSQDEERRITLAFGGAEMRAKHEKTMRVANDIQGAIHKKEEMVMQVVKSMTDAELFELMTQLQTEVPMDKTTIQGSRRSGRRCGASCSGGRGVYESWSRD